MSVQLMDRFEGGDIELGIEVIRRTKNKKDIGHIEGMLFSTGVVSGEDGLARAYEAKAEILKKYLNDGNKQVKEFSERMIKSLEESAKRELAEEVGIKAIQWQKIFTIKQKGTINQNKHYYIARQLRKIGRGEKNIVDFKDYSLDELSSFVFEEKFGITTSAVIIKLFNKIKVSC